MQQPSNTRIFQEFEMEIERLREENNQIRFAKDLRERDFENVLFENAQLQNKLENLENVFIGSSLPGGNNLQRSNNSRSGPGSIQTGNIIGGDNALSQDYNAQNLTMENNDLKRRIFMLEQEKIDLKQ